jgi:hypothetical protein
MAKIFVRKLNYITLSQTKLHKMPSVSPVVYVFFALAYVCTAYGTFHISRFANTITSSFLRPVRFSGVLF